MKLSYFADKFDSDPQNLEADFSDLPAMLREVASDTKDEAPLWSPALMEGGKTEGHTRSVEALALDFDGVEPPWERLAGWSYFAHTTHSHMTVCDKNPKGDLPFWRVVVELETPGDPKAWKDQFKAKMLLHDFHMDRSCCNPNRSFYVPPSSAEWKTNEGRPASMPTVQQVEDQLQRESFDLDDNTDGLLSDGTKFWPLVEQMMRTLPPSVSGHGGDDRLFEAACVCRSAFRLTTEATLKALRIFNERCEPAWDDDRLWYKANQAAHDKQNVPGSLVPEAVKKERRAAVEWVEPPPPAPLPPDFSQLWAPAGAVVACVTRVEYLCKELGIRDGRPSLWTADARCGKSTLAASVALAVAGGLKLWGALQVVEGPVCYVAGEDIEGVARNWKRLALQQRISIPDQLHISAAFPLAGPNVSPANLKVLFENHRLVIFDTLRSLSREGGIEENDPKFADGMYIIDKAAEGTGCSVIVLHHNNKQGRSNGTAALFGAAGNHIELTRSEESFVTKGFAAGTRDGLSLPSFQVTADLHACPAPKDDPDSEGIKLTYERLQANEQKVTKNAEGIMSRIYTRLREADRWLGRKELTSDLGKTEDITVALRSMRDQKKIGYKVEGAAHFYHWNPKMEPKA